MNSMITRIALPTVLLASSTVALANQQTWKEESLDAWIDGKAETILLFNPDLNSFDINTHVNHGVITLTGDVDNRIEKLLARELVEDLDGVEAVDNQLTILNTPVEKNRNNKALVALTDAKITTVIKTRLLMEDDISGLDINVDTNEHTVELTGEVASVKQHDLAMNIARNTQDVKHVINNLEVIQ
ncbi:BON domain-containing protein [Psychromonas sp. PT13]|uniref:BON domain-containing protein n=1 Tax=Psychromonas sp. PT13 TaxID=3439547 RepID=UPI003EBBE825